MKCPVCKDVNLVLSERLDVEIDYCPECRGVWLDRGELDKLIERSNRDMERPSGSAERYETSRRDVHVHSGDYGKSSSYYHKGGEYRHKKRKSFLADIFDSFGD